MYRDPSRCGLSQWKTTLYCNVVSHWLSPNPSWSLQVITKYYLVSVGPLLYSLWASWRSNGRYPWWRHQLKTFSVLLAICAGNSPVPGDFPAQRPVTQSFDVLFDLRLNKQLSKQQRGWWCETPSLPLWRHCDGWYNCNQFSHVVCCLSVCPKP